MRLDPRYHIYTAGMPNKASNCPRDMSLGLCFGCFRWRSFWGALVHLYLSAEASAKLEKSFDLQKIQAEVAHAGSKLQPTEHVLNCMFLAIVVPAVSCLLCHGSHKPGLKFNKRHPVTSLERSRF